MDLAAIVSDLDYRVGIAGTYHSDRSVALNELHPYFAAEGEGWGFGLFVNSEGNLSIFGGLRGETGPFWGEIGVATGYSGGAVVPFGRVGVLLGDDVRLFVAPSFNQNTGRFGAVVGIEGDLFHW